jgi:hypothetical protein
MPFSVNKDLENIIADQAVGDIEVIIDILLVLRSNLVYRLKERNKAEEVCKSQGHGIRDNG